MAISFLFISRAHPYSTLHARSKVEHLKSLCVGEYSTCTHYASTVACRGTARHCRAEVNRTSHPSNAAKTGSEESRCILFECHTDGGSEA